MSWDLELHLKAHFAKTSPKKRQLTGKHESLFVEKEKSEQSLQFLHF